MKLQRRHTPGKETGRAQWLKRSRQGCADDVCPSWSSVIRKVIAVIPELYLMDLLEREKARIMSTVTKKA